MADECRMVMIEDANFRITWECSACGNEHRATKKFEKSRHCPTCDATIVAWDGIYDDEEIA